MAAPLGVGGLPPPPPPVPIVTEEMEIGQQARENRSDFAKKLRNALHPSIKEYEKDLRNVIEMYNDAIRALQNEVSTGGARGADLEARVALRVQELNIQLGTLYDRLYDMAREQIRTSDFNEVTIANFIDRRATIIRFVFLSLSYDENRWKALWNDVLQQIRHEVSHMSSEKIRLIAALLGIFPPVDETAPETNLSRWRKTLRDRILLLNQYLPTQPNVWTRENKLAGIVFAVLSRYTFDPLTVSDKLTQLAAALIRRIYMTIEQGPYQANVTNYVRSRMQRSQPWLQFPEDTPDNRAFYWKYFLGLMTPFRTMQNRRDLAQALGINNLNALDQVLNGFLHEIIPQGFQEVANVKIANAPLNWINVLFYAIPPRPPLPLPYNDRLAPETETIP